MGMLFTCYQYLLIAHSINVYAVVVKNGRDRISRSMGKRLAADDGKWKNKHAQKC